MKPLSLRNIIISGIVLLGGIGFYFYPKNSAPAVTVNNTTVRDLSEQYQAKEEISLAMAKLQKGEQPAVIIEQSNKSQGKVALTFDGMTDNATTEGILTELQKYKAQGTFFLEGMNAAINPEAVNTIKKNGQKIGNYGYTGIAHLEEAPKEKIVSELVKTEKVLHILTDKAPVIGKAAQTKYTQDFLQCAKASGLNYLVQSNLLVPINDIDSQETADAFVEGSVRSGQIISFVLGVPADITKEKGKTDQRPAVDKQPGLKELPVGGQPKDLPKIVGYILASLQKQGYETADVENFADNNQPLTAAGFWHKVVAAAKDFLTLPVAYAANPQQKYMAVNNKMICTTEKAVPFSFTGLAKEQSVHNVLAALQELNSHGTFFVTSKEIKKHKALVGEILAQGNELGIAILPKAGETYQQVKKEIEDTRSMLETGYGVSTNVLRQFSGAIQPETLRAIADTNCVLVDNMVNVVQHKHKDAKNSDEVMKDIFGTKAFAVGRGWIVQIRMDYYNNENLAADMIKAIKRKKIDNIAYVSYQDSPASNPANDSAYVIKPVGEVLYNQNYLWQYPVSAERIIPSAVMKKPDFNVNKESDYLREFKKRYIGSSWVNQYNRMLGFSAGEMRGADKTGLIHTHDNAVFFSFDDWGTDVSVNQLLYILRKHNVRSNFCVLTHNVINNPNLLRAIALDGHDICAHTNEHKPMALRVKDKLKQYAPETPKEIRKDFAECYRRMLSVAGDVSYNGKPVVCKLFRPPTLAISREGTKELLDLGYQYIINGSSNIEDYSATSLTTMINRIKDAIYTQNKVRKGATLVMHMSDNSKYTALALDALLTENEKKPLNDPSRFICARFSDYLPDGYDQSKHFRF